MKRLRLLFLFLGATVALGQPLPPPTTAYTRPFLRSTNQSDAWLHLGIAATNQTQITNTVVVNQTNTVNTNFTYNVTNTVTSTNTPLSSIETNGAITTYVLTYNGAVPVWSASTGGSGGGVWHTIQEYWISSTNTGNNLGTYADPFDASTQVKFDAVMKMVTTTNAGNVVVHLGPGVFTTSGQFGGVASAWPLLSNTRLLGSGMGVTFVRLKTNPGVNVTVIGTADPWNNTLHSGPQTNCEVAYMTVDVNGQNNNSGDRAHGVSLIGLNMRIHDVTVINGFGTATGGHEGFALTIQGFDPYNVANTNAVLVNSGAVIENCIVTNVLGDYYNGPSIFECEGARINGNYVFFPLITNNCTTTGHGMNIAGDTAINVYGNHIFGGSDGIYSDGEATTIMSLTNVMVHDNIFDQQNIGVNFSPYATSPSHGIRVYNNTIKVNRWGNVLGCSFGDFTMRAYQFYAENHDVEIYGNNITGPGAYGTNYWAGYLGAPDGRNPGAFRIHNNTWDNSSLGVGIESTVTNTFYIYNNNDPKGELVTAIGTATGQTNKQQYIVGTLVGLASTANNLVPGTTVTRLTVQDNNSIPALTVSSGPGDRKLSDANGAVSVDWKARVLNNTNRLSAVPVLSWTNEVTIYTNLNYTPATASTLASFDASKNVTSVTNGTGVLNNNGSGVWTYLNGALTGIATNNGTGSGNHFTNTIVSACTNVGTTYFGDAQQSSVDSSGAASFASISGTSMTATTLVATNLFVDLVNSTNLQNLGTITNTTTTFNGVVVAQTYDQPTNTWGINTGFGIGTNSYISSGAATGGFTGINNGPSSTARWGELTITATGDITFTNPASVHTSDMLTSRVITNGNTAVISVEVLPARCTNMAIVQFK